MGYQLEGIEFTIATITAATDLATMIHPSTGSIIPNGITISANSDILDITAQGSTAKENRAGLGSWTATVPFYVPRTTKLLGNNGDLTYGDSTYDKWISEYELTVEAAVLDITSQDQVDKNFRYFRPSKLVGFSGSVSAFADSATVASIPLNSSTAISAYPTATFKLAEDGATDPKLAGSAILSQLSHSVVQNSTLQQYRYSLTGTGALTATAGSGGIVPIFPAGTVDQPDWDTTGNGDPDVAITMTAKSGGLTFSGFCFWRRLQVRVPMSGLITGTLELQGTGVYSIA